MNFFRLLINRTKGYLHQAIMLFLFGIMFSMIILGAIVAYSAFNYAKQNVGKYTEGSIQAKGCGDDDLEKFSWEGQKISFDWVKDLAADKRVKDYEVTSMAGVHGKNIMQMDMFDDELNKEDEKGNLLLVYQKNMMEHYLFRDLNNTIIEGRGLEEGETGNKAVIGKTIAEENEKSVGDMIKLETITGEDISLEVIGISSCEYRGNSGMPTRILPYNYIFTTKENVDRANQSAEVFEADFKLKDCKEADLVLAEILDAAEGQGFRVSTRLTGYHTILAAFTNSQTTIAILLAAAIGMGALVIGMFSVYSLSERLKEIGILIALGMKKWTIVAQYALELLIPVFCSNVLCLCIFSLVKEPLKDYIIRKIGIIPDLVISLTPAQAAGYFSCVLLMMLFSILYVFYKVTRCRPKELLIESN